MKVDTLIIGAGLSGLAAAGLHRVSLTEMPAGNLMLVTRRD